jgi:mRNA interferase RelE/StbE
MTAAAIRFTKSAKSDLARLDKPVATRIVKRIQWLGDHLDDTVPLPLTGPWQSFYKLRAGDYRVLYRLEHEREATTIVIEFVRHRREVYK